MSTDNKRDSFKLKEGSHLNAKQPIIGITGTGKQTYIWIGNNATDNKACYATLSGPKTLEKFAKQLLKALNP